MHRYSNLLPNRTIEHLHVLLERDTATDLAYAETAQILRDMRDKPNCEDIGVIEWIEKRSAVTGN